MSLQKNTFFLTGASIVQKAISFFYFVILAHFYGAHSIGQYTYALAFTTIFAILVDGGLTPVFIRFIARDATHAASFLRQTLRLKFFLLCVTTVLMACALFFLHQAFVVRYLIIAAASVMIFDSINLTLYGTLRGLHDLSFESVGIIVAQLVSFLIGLGAAYFGAPIIISIIGLGVGSAVHLCIALVGLSKYRTVLFSNVQSVQVLTPVRVLAREAAPFAIAGIFARGYSFLDTLILGSISFTASGLYSVPNKLTYAFQFIPLSLAASLYPTFSKIIHEDPKLAAKHWYFSERYLLVTVIFIVSAVIALSRKLLGFYGSEFEVAERTLIILSVSLVFSFLSYPTGALLNAAGKQHLQTTAMGCTLFVNACLNFILIPRFGPIGAAWSAVAGNFILFSVGAWYAHTRVLSLPWKLFLCDAAKIIVLGLIIGFFIYSSAVYIPWFVAGCFGALLFVVLLFCAGFFGTNEITLVKKFFHRV